MYGNSYVTYIESRYLELCEKSGNGIDIRADWQTKKSLYREMTKTTIYEFMNYSMHDESHSINILENIEMILGRKRIDKLSGSDLWLILNAAYAHDIGMVSEYENLEALWSNEDFKKYVEESRRSVDKDDAMAADYYVFLNGLLQRECGKTKFQYAEHEFPFDMHDSWPLDFRKNITLLMSNYIRKNHGNLSKQFFENPTKTNNYLVCDRLYRLIGAISACHVMGHDSIEQLPRRCKGFGTDLIHPRFVAMLLRLGDLLDLDNNRFDLFSLKHFGPLPNLSVANFKKHKSITHFHIEPKIIEVTAQSDDFDVCKLHQNWFQYLRSDIDFFITRWSTMAPKEMRGCLLGLPKLEILHGSYTFKDDSIKGFTLEKQKLLKLFTGNNLYTSSLDFIREYIQNAFDASKLQLYYDVCGTGKEKESGRRSIKTELYLKTEGIDLKNIKPFDFTKIAYEAFTIVISLAPDPYDAERFIMRIADRGIGIDKEGLESITNVGSGWRKRDNHTAAILSMREWMRPTGGFGIGLQSAFLVTEEAKIYTKSAFEDGYCITISKYSNDKNVLIEVNHDGLLPQGTTVEFSIRFDTFDKPEITNRYLKEDLEKKDLFSIKGKMEIVHDIVKQYIEETFPCSFFPIQLVTDDGSEYKIPQRDIIESKYVYKTDNKRYEIPDYTNCTAYSLTSAVRQSIAQFHNVPEQVYINTEGNILRIWDDSSQIFYYFSLPANNNELINIWANYKNVAVSASSYRINISDAAYPEFVNTIFDVMGLKVDECLVVSRNSFRNEETTQKFLLNDYSKAYAHYILRERVNEEHPINLRIPGRVLLYACLIESSSSIINNIIKSCDTTLAGEMVQCLEFTTTDSNYSVHKTNISAKTIIENQNKCLLLSKADFYTPKNREVPYLCKSCSKEAIILDNQGLKDIELTTLPGIQILTEKKILVLIDKYIKHGKEPLIDFMPTITDRLTKAYVININSKFWPPKRPATAATPNNFEKILDQRFTRTYQIVNDSYNGKLAPLVVNKIPFQNSNPNRCYIISPYTNDIGMQVEKMQIGCLFDLVSKDPSFESLCEWVYKNQKNEKKYSISDIKNAYEALISQHVNQIRDGDF